MTLAITAAGEEATSDHRVGWRPTHDSAVAFVFLLPMFFLRIFIGGEGSDYADYPGISLSPIGYICHFGLVGYALLVATSLPSARRIALWLLFSVLSLVQIANLEASGVFPASAAAGPLLRGVLWLAFIGAAISLIKRPQALVETFVLMAKITVVVVIGCFFFFLVTGVPFGVYIAKGLPRPHGFLSEPSGLGYVLPALAMLTLYLRERRWFLISLAAIAQSLSVVTVAVTIILLPIVGLLALGRRRTAIALLVLFGVTSVAAPIIPSTEFGRDVINEVSFWAHDHIKGIDSENVLVTGIYVRIIGALEHLSQSLVNYDPSNLGGGLARLVGAIRVYDELGKVGAENIGVGLNVYGYVATRDDIAALIDFGFVSYLNSSFGVLMGAALFGLTVLAAIRALSHEPLLGVLLVSQIVATSYNSAAGIHAYALPMLGLMLLLTGSRWLSVSRATPPRRSELRARVTVS